jgi:hypothetical protein
VSNGIAYALSAVSFVQAVVPFVADKPVSRAYRRSLNNYLCSDKEDELDYREFLANHVDGAQREEVLVSVVRRISSTTTTIIALLTADVALFALTFIALNDHGKSYSRTLAAVFISGLVLGLVLLMALGIRAVLGKVNDYPPGRVRNWKFALVQDVWSFQTLTPYKR